VGYLSRARFQSARAMSPRQMWGAGLLFCYADAKSASAIARIDFSAPWMVASTHKRTKRQFPRPFASVGIVQHLS
jgi:hypothetical protein